MRAQLLVVISKFYGGARRAGYRVPTAAPYKPEPFFNQDALIRLAFAYGLPGEALAKPGLTPLL